MVQGRGWIDAAFLKVGDLLVTPDGTTVPIEAIETEQRAEADAETVYNFHVETHHNYYVHAGDTAVLVHNTLHSRPGSIAQHYDVTVKQVKEAIHKVKNQGGWRGDGGRRNPDIIVDDATGEVYPQLPNGKPADESIGNILDHLPE